MNSDDTLGDAFDIEPLFSKPFALPAIVLLTAMGIGLTIICASIGYTILFQNIFYLPIILTCISSPKKGLLFTAALALVYFFLLLGITQDARLIVPALVRVAFFMIVAGFIVYLALVRQHAYTKLNAQTQNLSAIVERKTALLAEELQQSNRLEKVYRETSEYYERIFDRLHIPVIICNPELYITRTNKAFENVTETPKTELIGRNLQSIIPFNQISAMEESKSRILEIPLKNGQKLKMLWSFSALQSDREHIPEAFIATGMEMPETWNHEQR